MRRLLFDSHSARTGDGGRGGRGSEADADGDSFVDMEAIEVASAGWEESYTG